MEFKEGYAINEANEELEAINNFKEDETKRAAEAATNAIKGAPFYDSTFPLDRAKDKCVRYLIKDFDCSSLLNGISKSLLASILWRIKEEIRDKAKAAKGFGLGDEQAKGIIGLKANLTSSLSEASFYIGNGGRCAKEPEALPLEDVPGVARKLWSTRRKPSKGSHG